MIQARCGVSVFLICGEIGMTIQAVFFDMGGTIETYGWTPELRIQADSWHPAAPCAGRDSFGFN